MLQNAYFLAKIGADTAENQRHSAKNLPKICKFLFSKETVDWDRAFADELKKRKELGTVDTKPVPPPRREVSFKSVRQTLQGSFSAVSKPTFASKY